jgi:hypothetical protein
LTPAETARALFDLADRVGRLKPLNRDPEAFFVDRSEIARLARKLQPGARPESPRPREAFAEGLIRLKGRLIPASVRRRRAINFKGRAA